MQSIYPTNWHFSADKTRVAVSKSLAPITVTDSEEDALDDDDDEEEEVEATPVAPKRKGHAPLRQQSTPDPPDADISAVGEIAFDSIMDVSDEEDDDEVDNLL